MSFNSIAVSASRNILTLLATEQSTPIGLMLELDYYQQESMVTAQGVFILALRQAAQVIVELKRKFHRQKSEYHRPFVARQESYNT